MFGEIVRQIRMEKRISLRDFCIRCDRDPSNWSKVERGALPAPTDARELDRICKVLGLEEKSDAWLKLRDAAAIDRGIIPHDLMKQEEIRENLPAFFRTLRGPKPTPEERERLLNLIRES